MRPLTFSINVTLDGCIDHRAGIADIESHRHATELIERADALIFGRVTYELMFAWRPPASDAMPDWTKPFARAINAAKKYVVSNTLPSVDWNSELLRGDLGNEVRALKEQPGKELFVGGAKLALALTELGLIDEYYFVVTPRLTGHGPRLFDGLSKYVDLKLLDQKVLGSGAVVMHYAPKR